MITLVIHEADRPIAGATRVLREFSAAGLLGDLALVNAGETDSPGGPRCVCVRAGEETETGLFDALATDPAVDGVMLTAVASGDLAPEHQRDLAEAALGIADQIMKLAGIQAATNCLFVPESAPGAEILPAAGYFSARTANLVALPTDWQCVDAVHVGIDYADGDRAAWHAALEIASVTSSWAGVVDSRWQPKFSGVAHNTLCFVRSAARLVTLSQSGPRAAVDGTLPVPEGFQPTPVPGLISRAVPVLHPEAFRLDGALSETGDPGRSGPLMILVRAISGVFPPLASGLRGFGRVLRDEVVKALGGEGPSTDGDQRDGAGAESQPAEVPSVVLEGFEHGVWTDLVRNVLGLADGGGTPDAAEARRVAGHKQYVFVTRDSLVDDVLEQRLAEGGSEGLPSAVQAAASDDGEESPDSDPSSDAPVDSADSGAGPAEDGGRRGLLTLVDDAFRRETVRALARRRAQQRERDELAEQVAQTEHSDPPAAFRVTLAAFLITGFVVGASYVLLLDAFDFGDVDEVFRTRLAIAATAVTWLVLQYPLAPRGDDPRVVQSYLLRSAAVVAVVAGLAAVFAGPISDFASGRPWLELIPVVAAVVTVRLAWRVLRSAEARERPAGRAVALGWTVCYLVSGLLLYANMERSVFNRWGWARRFFEEYGDGVRYAAAAVAVFLLLLAVALFAVSDSGSDRHRRRARAQMRELDRELQYPELRPILQGLRTNWLGTAAALDHILTKSFPLPSPAGEAVGRLRSPLLRFAVRRQEAYAPPPPPGWLFTQYERAVDAYSAQRSARSGTSGRVRPEAATMVSRLDCDLLAVPGSDPRWDFARRLRTGEFDDVLAADSANAPGGSLQDSDREFLRQIAPVAPIELPLGLLGPSAAALGKVAMNTTWWWPDGFQVPDALTQPLPARTGPADGGQAHIAVRLDVSDPVLEGQLRGEASPQDNADVQPPDDGDDVPGRDDGLR